MPDNPEVVSCPAGVWTLVAASVTSATIHKRSHAPELYLQTYRIAGQAAPTDDALAILIFASGLLHNFAHTPVVDLYIKAVGADGSVRLDA